MLKSGVKPAKSQQDPLGWFGSLCCQMIGDCPNVIEGPCPALTTLAPLSFAITQELLAQLFTHAGPMQAVVPVKNGQCAAIYLRHWCNNFSMAC